MSGLVLYRIARALHRAHIPLLPAALKWFNCQFFGSYVPYTATIGRGTRLGYLGMSVVIHDRAVIGEHCLISHGVTLGGTSRKEGVPRLGAHVYVGAGAKILGDVEIGDRAVIGANAVVTRSVPANCLAVGIPARVIKEGIDARDYHG